jgi:NAD(P)-dependent dehydrogenase (short-subunit alcohol dehydrogenase family)
MNPAPSVLVTGASKGIGRATAAEFARRGYRVVATARDPRTLDDLELGEHGDRLALDVTNQESVDAAVAAAGQIDILVSNAGVIFVASVEATPPAELERIFAANTSGSLRIAQAVLPQMRQRGSGRLLFVSSVIGRVVLPGNAAYAATKWALEALVEGLATEVRHFGIGATLLQPGPVSSGALDDPLEYALPDDPYAPLLAQRGDLSSVSQTPAQVAVAIADAAALEVLPLRIPIGDWTAAVLAARAAAPYDVPFLPAPVDW